MILKREPAGETTMKKYRLCKTPVKIPLVKIIHRQYLDRLLAGELYMKTLKYFRSIEESTSPARHDKHEGLNSIHHNARAVFTTDAGEKFTLNEVTATLSMSHEELNWNVFCMIGYRLPCIACSPECYPFTPTERLFDFLEGSPPEDYRAVLFHDSSALIERVKETITNSKDLSLEFGYVDYVDPNQNHCKLGAFKKIDKYYYQSEYRLLLHDRSESDMTLKIGDISDISTVMSFRDFVDAKIALPSD